jgi:steroid 5-alpha reductase family enzyme
VRVLAAVLALLAVIAMIVAVAGMVTGRPGDRAGGVIRILALALFVAAVVLNVVSR